jgi:hypothetical protein
MNHIFISHAGGDSAVAERLYEDLKNAGHEARIDKCELRLGANSIQFMNEGIAQAQAVVILFSKSTPSASWQKIEIDGAVWNEIQQGGATCIVIRLDSTPLPPLLGLKVFASLDPDHANYEDILSRLCATVFSPTTSSSVVADAFRSDSRNPFKRVRAEFFEDVPRLLADAFAPPDAMKMSALEEMKPCLLEGPRGTGKSMLLLALRARNLSSRKGVHAISRLFGFYIKLSRGAVCSAGVSSDQNTDPKSLQEGDMVQLADAFSQELMLCLLESLFSEIRFCIRESYLTCDAYCEQVLASMIYKKLRRAEVPHQMMIDDLLERLADIHRELADFIRRKFIYREVISVPIAVLDIEMFKDVLHFVKQTIPALQSSMFVVLLDEYENLFPFQQRVANALVKLAAPDFTVKVAKKLGVNEISGTTTGQELQEIHDYNRVPLVYDVENVSQMKLYRGLLKSITEKLLAGTGLTPCDVTTLLPKATGLEIDHEPWLKEIANLHKISVSELEDLPAAQKDEKITYYSQAAIYRVLYGRGGRQKNKSFSGFDDLAFLSSGVIRYFLEILGVAFHLQHADGFPASGPITFTPEIQSKAAHIVSQHYLTTLSRNVEVYGEQMKYFVLELGDCVRHKLLHHTSEPEAGRLTIIDPQNLEDSRFSEIQKVLSLGMREGVFQTREGRPAFKPKHSSDPQPVEVSICRIYAPVLQISPRQRWRTNLSCHELLSLWEPVSRAKAKRTLLRKLAKAVELHPQLTLGNSHDENGI